MRFYLCPLKVQSDGGASTVHDSKSRRTKAEEKMDAKIAIICWVTVVGYWLLLLTSYVKICVEQQIRRLRLRVRY